MLITVCLSAIEKHGLECFVHLEGPSPWLAALWRLMGWSGSEGLVMPGQSSPRVVLLQGAWPLSRKGGRAGTTGGHRLLHCFTAHTQTDFGLYHRMGFSAFLWEVQKAEIMSVLLFTSTALPLCLTLTSANNRVTPSGLVEDSGYCANVRVQNNLNSVHLLPFLELTTTAHGCCWGFFPPQNLHCLKFRQQSQKLCFESCTSFLFSQLCLYFLIVWDPTHTPTAIGVNNHNSDCKIFFFSFVNQQLWWKIDFFCHKLGLHIWWRWQNMDITIKCYY